MDISYRPEITVPIVEKAEDCWKAACALTGLSDIGSKRIIPDQPVFRLLADESRIYADCGFR